jgi:hypothetical protein
MCFSPIASFAASAALGAAGAGSVAKTARKSEIPFASIPLLFGAQQLTEGIVWLTFGSQALQSVATFAYLLFSHVLWPVYIPLAVWCMETVRWRRILLLPFIAVGAVVGAYFLYYLFVDSVMPEIVNNCIAYNGDHFYRTFVLSPYSVATCASCLFSSHRFVNVFGVLTFLAAIVSYRFFQANFVSVWCFFSAILSALILWYFLARRKKA